MSPRSAAAEIAVIGGSGFYAFLDDAEEVAVDTPFGAPSSPVSISKVGDRPVAFLARHGPHHEHPPHRINYRANLWALDQMGVRRVIAPCAAGSLRVGLHPGDVVVCDQLVDLTSGRDGTFFDGGIVNHVAFADPYCRQVGRVLCDQALAAGMPAHPTGTVVVVQGPRFSTRAESKWFRQNGWDLVNMTQYPEAVLARELGMCYSALAVITDYDAGVEGDETVEPVTMVSAFEVLAANADRTRKLLMAAIPALPATGSCACSRSRHDSLAKGSAQA